MPATPPRAAPLPLRRKRRGQSRPRRTRCSSWLGLRKEPPLIPTRILRAPKPFPLSQSTQPPFVEQRPAPCANQFHAFVARRRTTSLRRSRLLQAIERTLQTSRTKLFGSGRRNVPRPRSGPSF